MRSSLSDLSFLQNDDFICVSDGGESMSDHNDGLTKAFVSQDLIESLLDLMFRLSIQSTGCLIEEQDLWLSDESSSNSNSLLLAT